jgi:hypothetical protein
MQPSKKQKFDAAKARYDEAIRLLNTAINDLIAVQRLVDLYSDQASEALDEMRKLDRKATRKEISSKLL